MMDRLRAIRDVVCSYLYGVVVGTVSIIAIMFVTSIGWNVATLNPGLGAGLGLYALFAWPVIAGGSMVVIVSTVLLLGIPLLLTAIAVVLIFLTCIERRLLAWCSAAPFVAALAWVVVAMTVHTGRGTGFDSPANHPAAPLYTALVFAFAIIGSWKFYRLRRGPKGGI